jgi:hypothetical protein
LETYKLQLFTSNPIADANTTILANYEVTTDAKGYASKTFDVDVLKTDSTLYACYEDKYGNRYVKAVGVGNGNNIDITFGSPASTAMRSIALTRADEEKPYYDLYKDGVAYNDVYKNVMQYENEAVELSDENYTIDSSGDPNYHKVLKIPAGTTWNKTIGILGTGRVLYVYGTYKISSETKLGGDGLIVVCNGGKLICESTLETTEGAYVVVLSGGEVSGSGKIQFSNGTGDNYGYIAPGATVNIGTLNNNGGLVYNYGTLTAGTIMGGSGISSFVNNGKMYITDAGTGCSNLRLYNNCWMEITKDLWCRNLIMGPSSYIKVGGVFTASGSDDGTSDLCEVRLAENSYAQITAIYDNNANIVGPCSGYAVLEIGRVEYANWSPGSDYIKAGYIINNIYISIDNRSYKNPNCSKSNCACTADFIDMMNGEVTSWSANYKTLGNNGVKLISRGQSGISIPSSDCTEGYEGNTTTGGTTNEYNNPQTLIFACEDLGGTDDYDFNDVVFSVSHVSGETTATVKALAAGGTYPATIYYKSSETDSVLIGEIHARLNPSSSTSVMLNTNENTSLNTYTDKGVQITVPENWTISDNRDKFIISINTGAAMNGVYISQTISSEMEAGKAPQVIVLPSDWQWPIERVKMTEAYPDFGNWSANSDDYKWIENKVSSKLIAR